MKLSDLAKTLAISSVLFTVFALPGLVQIGKEGAVADALLWGASILAALFVLVGLQFCGRARAVWVRLQGWASKHPVWCGAGVTLPLWLIVLSPPGVSGLSLDDSWQEVLSYAHVHGLRFGSDLLFTAGPSGFLFTNCALPETVVSKLIWEFSGKLLLVVALVYAGWALPLWRRLAFFLFVGAFTCLFPDAFYVVLILMMGFRALIPAKRPLAERGCAIAVIVFLGLAKFTYLMFGAGVCFAAVLGAFLRNDRKSAFSILGFGSASFALFWLLLGQSFPDIPSFIYGGLNLSDGYSWSMMLAPSRYSVICGIPVAVLSVIALLILGFRCEDRARGWPFLLVGLLGLYLSWKHGFTRGDSHVRAFFGYALALACILPSLFGRKENWYWSDMLVPLCILGFWSDQTFSFEYYWRRMEMRMQERTKVVLHPARALDAWRSEYAERKSGADLPRIRAAVGDAPVDLLNYDQSWVFYNGLNFRPRPVFQSYSVHTVVLERLNRDFYRSQKAPEFVMVRPGSIDGRYPSQDDALVLAELPWFYRPILAERGFVLLKRRPGDGKVDFENRIPLESKILKGGETLKLSAEGRQSLWLQVKVRPTVVGLLRAYAYRPAELTLVVAEKSGFEKRYRLLPKTAGEGFLLSPVIENQSDLDAYLTQVERRTASSIRVECRSGESSLWRPFEVTVSRLPDLPLAPRS